MAVFTPQVRTYLYGVVSAALPLLVTAGIMAPADIQQWLLLAGALLGLGSNLMAAANVNQTKSSTKATSVVVEPSAQGVAVPE